MQTKLLWGLSIIAVGIVVFCMVFLMEQYESTEWTGQSEKAARNPFLAAERFLEQRGVEVVKTTDQIDFDQIPTDQTVILTEVDGMLVTQRQVDKALAWIHRGGYMIVGVGKEIQGQTSILREFEIEPEELEVKIDDLFLNQDGEAQTISERLREINKKIDERQAEEAKKNVEEQSPAQGEGKRDTTDKDDDFNQQLLDLLNPEFEHEYFRLSLEGDESLFIAVLDRIVLNHPLFYDDADHENESDEVESEQTTNGYTLSAWSADENGLRLLQMDYGQGSFVALSGSELWENGYIGKGDHAYFLSYLVPDNSTLQLFYNVQSPALYRIAHRYFYESIWAAFALLALWLWYRGIRVQRISLDKDSGRRNFAEHLRSSAEFLTRNNQFSALLLPVKHDIEQQLRAQYPNFSQLNEATQTSILIEKTKLSTPAIESWLAYCKNIDNREQLFAALQLGNAIRKQL